MCARSWRDFRLRQFSQSPLSAVRRSLRRQKSPSAALCPIVCSAKRARAHNLLSHCVLAGAGVQCAAIFRLEIQVCVDCVAVWQKACASHPPLVTIE